MSIENKALVLDLLEWIGPAPRPYEEVMAAWRTSCPRLPVWEDALDAGFVSCSPREGCMSVQVTTAGQRFLDAERTARGATARPRERDSVTHA